VDTIPSYRNHHHTYRLFFDLFLNATSTNELVSSCLELLGKSFPVDHGWVSITTSESRIQDSYSLFVENSEIKVTEGLIGETVPHCADKILFEAQKIIPCKECPYYSKEVLDEMLFPLTYDNEVIGMLAFAITVPLSENDELFLKDVISDFNLALTRTLKSREASHKMFSFFEQPLALLVVCDITGYFTEVNCTWESLLGYTSNDLIGHTIMEFIHPDDVERTISEFTKMTQSSGMINLEFRMLRKDDGHKWIHWSGKFDSKIGQIYGYGVDITDRKQVEEELQKKTELFLTVVHNSIPIIVLYDTDGVIQLSEGKALEAVGLKESEEVGLSLYDLYPDKSVIIDGTNRSLKGESVSFRVSVRDVPFQVYQSPVYSLEGEIQGGMAMAIDISQEVEVESEKLLMLSIIEQVTESIVITDIKGNITFVNPTFEKQTGYTQAECIGKNPSILQSGKHTKEFYSEMWASLLADKTWKGVLHNVKKNGEPLIEKTVITGARNAEGTITHYVSVKLDITDEIKLEKQRHQSEKMDAIGHLAGGIAHDFNNILSAIMGYSEMASWELTEDHSASPMIQEVIKASSRAKQLVNQILNFSRSIESSYLPIHIGVIMKEVISFVRATLPSTIKIESNIEKESKAIIGDAIKIHEIIMNLCTNASHSISSYGTITLTLEEQTRAESFEGRIGMSKPGDYAVIKIADTGSGMTESVMDHLFDPYFMTKDEGKGTGMGLSVVLGIIKEMHGNITVESKEGTGTVFTIYFPQSDKKASSKQYEQNSPLGDESILFIDDEVMLGNMFKTMLTALGYSVTYCSNSVNALEIYEDRSAEFDIIITDQTMPYLMGADFVKQVRKFDTEVPIILCSGQTDDLLVNSNNEISVNKILHKPLKRSQIAQAIRHCLDN